MDESSDARGRRTKIPGVGDYDAPAGGWDALRAVAGTIASEMAVGRKLAALHHVNQPLGFDCPGCAWPDPRETSSFEFCENGAKAVAWEATAKRAKPAFFAANPVAKLWNLSDHALEALGRITHPMRYDAATDTYREVAWDEAYAAIGAALRALPSPDAAEFYTSGRASNEAAYLYQLFVRELGTNNFPDCSNLCHEATSVGLPHSIGVGKGTVTLDDFALCDAIFCIGHNPGTNHPRMLSTLRDAARRGVPIVVLNPMPERGLERFTSPQHPVEMLAQRPTTLASSYYKLRCGGDVAVFKGMMKWLVANDRVDRAFVEAHTEGLEALLADLDATAWDDIERAAGLARDEIEAAATVYANAERVIVCYGMGLTQHRHGVDNVQQLANLLLMRGNVGKPGAGICPLRGHSNVQGDRTVGISERPTAAFLDALERRYGFAPPRRAGHDAVAAIRAMRDGAAKALVSLGGNLAVAMSDTHATFAALARLDLAVHVTTKLNRSHLILAKQNFILPCLGRTERDLQASGPQAVTVEDSMSMVHASQGTLEPASPELRSEPAIVAGIAKATLPQSRVPWDALVGNYDLIRDEIEAVLPMFAPYNARIREPGGFRLPIAASSRVWATEDGRAHFLVSRGLGREGERDPAALTLTTVRAHDQYNTTIYSPGDRYRGIASRRDVVFAHEDDLAARGLAHGDRIDVVACAPNGSAGTRRVVRGFVAVAYPIARGTVAMYFPEGNVLVALDDHDARSGTPSYKSVDVRLERAGAGT